MCNSGSSALYLAVELLDLPPGSEVITSPLTFSTDLAPLIRSDLTPVFVDVELDTFNVDVDGIEALIGDATRAILIPNLAGNAPDWDRIRALADRYHLRVVEDSCDVLGARLRGTPTGTRSDISVTSFALSHIITCAGNGGMVMLDDEAQIDRCLSLRRWGRRSEPQLFGSRQGRTKLLGGPRRDPLRQPLHLRRRRVELRTVGARRGVRTATTQETCPQLRAAPAQLRALLGVPGSLPRSIRRPAPDRRIGDCVALVCIPPAARLRVRSERPPGVPRARGDRDPYGVER